MNRTGPTTSNYGATIPGDTYAELVAEELEGLWDRSHCWIENIAGTNSITGTAVPTLGAYAKGQGWQFIPAATNTGPTVMNIDSRGNRDVLSPAGAPLSGGEIILDTMTRIVDDGTDLRLVAGQTVQASVGMAIFSLTKAANVAGGSTTAGARQTYPLNTTILNEIAGASLSVAGGTQFKVTLPAGSYEVVASATFNQAGNGAKLFLRDDTALAAITTAADVQMSALGTVQLEGKFTITVTSLITMQYRVQSSQNTNGLGIQMNQAETESYGFIRFKKVA